MNGNSQKNQWLQIAAIILGLMIHGSVIAFQLGKLTQLVSSMEARLVTTEITVRMAEKELVSHKLTHPDRELDKRLSAIEARQ